MPEQESESQENVPASVPVTAPSGAFQKLRRSKKFTKGKCKASIALLLLSGPMGGKSSSKDFKDQKSKMK